MTPLAPEIRHRLAALLAGVDPAVFAAIVAHLSTIYTPSCPFNCWEWVEKFINIPPLESPKRHGPYRSELLPHVRRLMEFVTHPTDRVFIARKSSQIGFTLAYLLIICFLAATNPRHVLFSMDSADEGKNISERLKRLILYNQSLAHVTTTDGGADDLQNLLLKLRAMNVWFVGAGSPGGYANKAAGIVFLDELDLYEKKFKNGDETFHRAMERIKDDPNGKFIAGGKPEGFEYPTNKYWRRGTREEIYLPCLRCDHFQPIRFEAFRFEHCKDLAGHYDLPRVEADTYVECEFCHKPMRDEEKPTMLRRYKCVATNKGQDDDKPIPGWVSLWVNDLTSILPQHAWGKIALDFIGKQGDIAGLRTFFHGVIARPEAEQKTEVTKSALAKLNGGYDHGCIPKRPAYNPVTGQYAIFLCSDVQGSGEKKWVKIGITAEGEAFVIDYGKTLGLHDLLVEADKPVWLGHRAPPESELEALLAEALATSRPYSELLRARYPDREFYTVSAGFVDEGHDTFVVRDFCHGTRADPLDPGSPLRFYPCKGIPRANATELVMEIADKFRTAKDGGEYVTVYHFSDDDLKRELYIGRIAGFDGVKNNAAATPRLWFPAYAEEWFLKELMQEKRALVKDRGRMVWMWEKPKDDNDYGDALKMCFALWHVVRDGFAPELQPPAPPPPQEPLRQAA